MSLNSVGDDAKTQPDARPARLICRGKTDATFVITACIEPRHKLASQVNTVRLRITGRVTRMFADIMIT